MEYKARVILPLYIYPLSEKTWLPLYEAISDHPNVDFMVVVNPNSGPGELSLPGHDYIREVPRLNAYLNVSTVGYIRIDYCRKPLNEVYAEIDTYAGWTTQCETSGLGVEGIFFDETPNHYSKDRAEYLNALRQHVKSTMGLLGTRIVIHNPGTPPDAGLASGPDVIVTCEEPYDRYQSEEVQQRLKEYHHDRAISSYLISAVPREEVRAFARQLRRRGAYLFVTDLDEDFYESFGSSWIDLVSAMEAA